MAATSGIERKIKDAVETGRRRTITALFNRIVRAARANLFFSASFLAAVITSFFNAPRWEYIDFKVILCLFGLMIIVKAFEEYGLLHRIAVTLFNRCKNERILTRTLCLLSFVLAMFVTNDVALLTIVPIMIVISRKSSYHMVLPCILTAIAANLGSSMTPIGNPQNLFIFSFYHLDIMSFLMVSFPLCVLSLALLLGLSFFIKPRPIDVVMDNEHVAEKKKVAVFGLLSVLAVLSVLNVISYALTFFLIVLVTLLVNRKLLKTINYPLLLTFVFIFIAVGNISHIPAIKDPLTGFVHTPAATYLSSLFLSQIISNVPSTVMLAPFTSNVQALFYGANIGGLGTPVASLASLIAYTLFSQEYPQQKRDFLSKFMVLNVGCLIVLGLAFLLIINSGGF